MSDQNNRKQGGGSRKPAQSRSGSSDGGGKWGCLIVIVCILGGVLWGLYDSGVFDRDDSRPVVGGGLFGSSGAQQLTGRLAAASQAHGICYGWHIDTDHLSLRRYDNAREDAGRPGLGVDAGSNLGPGTDPRQAPEQCPRWVLFTADYNYDVIDEEWTSVVPDIETNLPLSLGPSDLAAAGISTRDLLGDHPDARLADAIGALPMIVADKGGAQQPVPGVAAQNAPPGAEPTSPGIGRFIWMGIAVVLIAGGLLWIVIAAVRHRARSRAVPTQAVPNSRP